MIFVETLYSEVLGIVEMWAVEDVLLCLFWIDVGVVRIGIDELIGSFVLLEKLVEFIFEGLNSFGGCC